MRVGRRRAAFYRPLIGIPLMDAALAAAILVPWLPSRRAALLERRRARGPHPTTGASLRRRVLAERVGLRVVRTFDVTYTDNREEHTMRPTEPFRDEHEQLLEHIEHLAHAAREMPRLSEPERDALRDRVLGFLRGTLMPHAEAEEDILYPEWAKLVGFADAAVPMVHDHQAIVARIERLQAVDVGDVDVDALQELLYGLYALISVHFRKEEDLQLPVLDANPEVAERVLARMHETTGHAHTH